VIGTGSHGFYHSTVHAGTVQYSTRTVYQRGGGESRRGRKKKRRRKETCETFDFSQYGTGE